MDEPMIVMDARRGKAVVAGTDVTVEEILVASAEGRELVGTREGLTREGVAAALRYAAGHVDREGAYVPPPPGAGTYAARERAVAYGPDGVDEHDELLYRLDLLEDVSAGLADAAVGRTVPHDEVFQRLLAEYPA